MWSEYTVVHDFAHVVRNLHLYQEISCRLKEVSIHQTLPQYLEHMNQSRNQNLKLVSYNTPPTHSLEISPLAPVILN